ncbi:alpha-glucosidase [Desarmillaria tabescens]|uniref:alpha-D-xyloside xylohydrolase n=1 Tax=Armillaria tabescens TaxID=1929756 RepID=A0AA39KGM4_ARMTA|nr:alpha-glucosidase [Desarmillaria tabescens]KAK0459506.1 alpha-glucosidase [Desarmillaria tabescens]
MKFNDGFWLLKNGVRPYFGIQVVDVHPTSDGLGYDLHVATKPVNHRGDTLAGPVFTIKVYSPTEGVIGVKIDHFSTIKSTTNIHLFPDDPPIPNVTLDQADRSFSVSSGGLTAVVTGNPYTVTFKSQHRTLTSSGHKYLTLYDIPSKWTLTTAANSSCLMTDRGSNPNPEPKPDIVRYLHSELNTSPGELVYGFGEQFGAFVKNGNQRVAAGQSIRIWNQDGGTSSDQAYKCVPFYITNRNYGVFINNPGEVEVEVGSEKVSRVGISLASNSLEYFIIYGRTPLEILERYTRMTGRPAILPSWTFGLWLSTSFLTSYSSDTVSGFLQGMQERKCPVRVFHLDCFWMKQYEWCSFTFDPDNFPDPKTYLSEIKQKYGVKICLWINPYISQLSPVFQEGVQGDFFIKRKDGTLWQWDLWQPGLAVVDFTNPAAGEWYKRKLEALLDLGVDCFKASERIPYASVVYHDGADPMRMHNMYSIIYNELVFNILKERFGEGEAVVFARASFVGGQRFPVHWGGDCESSFEAMAETIRGCLSLTLSGFAFASHDIGGFEGHPPPEIYQRWVAFGLFSSHSRLHGSSSYRVPWSYGEDAAKSMARFLDTKHQLMPYLYDLAIQARIKGHPMQRAMFLEFPDDPTTQWLDRQYMLGPSLLVAPVFVPIEEESVYYVPAGRWTYYWDQSRTVVGPLWVREVVPLDEIPLWIRPGTILATGPKGIGRPDYNYTQGINVNVYGLLEGQTLKASLPAQHGIKTAAVISAERTGTGLRLEVQEGECDISFLGIHEEGIAVKSVVGGAKFEEHNDFVGLKLDGQLKEVVCTMGS